MSDIVKVCDNCHREFEAFESGDIIDGYKHLVMTEHEFNNNYTVSNVVEN